MTRLTWQPTPNCLSADVDGATVVMNPSMQYVELDATGAAIWSALQQQHDVDGIVAAMTGDYDVDEATLRRDIVAYLPKLEAVGLIVALDE